jgi:hypothetical protein
MRGVNSPPPPGSLIATQRGYKLLLAATAILLAAGCWFADSLDALIGYGLLTLAVAAPAALWLRAGALGIPVLPITSAVYFVYYALPILRADAGFVFFTQFEVLSAAVSVTLFLTVATLACQATRSLQSFRPSRAFVDAVSSGQLSGIILAGLGLGLLYFLSLFSGFLDFLGPLFGLLRAVFLTATDVASFLLGYAIASGLIRGSRRALALACLVGVVALSLSTLFLVAAITYILSAILGYVITAKRVPWTTLAMLGSALFVLHAGKEEMRQKYWMPDANYASDSSVLKLPGMIVEWVSDGVSAMTNGGYYQDVIDRASLIKLLMIVKRLAPDRVPFLNGESYSYLPYMLVPRFVQGDKTVSQASMMLLNIRFGFQSQEGAASTAIGWGLIPEAYANYGDVAVVLVALVVGAFAGLLTGWSERAPVISAPTLVTIAAMMALVNVEADFSYLFTNIFQGCAAVLIFYTAFRLISGRGKRSSGKPKSDAGTFPDLRRTSGYGA